jgi:solute carrier family 13 (sodium-dependent dicarboxylate transporter), member 2/3/5
VRIDWGTIILFGAGIALGTLMGDTGLAKVIGDSTAGRVGGLEPHLDHHRLRASRRRPLRGDEQHGECDDHRADRDLDRNGADVNPVIPALAAIFGANYGFMLPVSTPPNAIVYASGMIPITRMLRTGVVVGDRRHPVCARRRPDGEGSRARLTQRTMLA